MAKSRVIDRDLGWKAILQAAGDLAKGSFVRVGILGDDTRGGLHQIGPDGKPSPLTVAEIAVVNEYGTEDGHVPARPAHRMAFDANREAIERAAFRALVGIVLDRKLTVEQGLGLLGLMLATAIKKQIVEGEGVPPPNAPATIAAKGSSRPLVDTGATLSAISWAVTIGTDQKAHRYLKR